MGDNIAIWGTAGSIAVLVLIAGMKCERRSGSECELIIRFQPVKEQDQ